MTDGPRVTGGTDPRPRQHSQQVRNATRAQRARGQATADTQQARGHRARRREEEARTAQRRRLAMILGIATAAVIIIGVVVSILVFNQPSSNAQAITATGDNAIVPSQNPPKTGQTAPGFNLPTLDGKYYSLSALHGKPVLLEFFADWCPICQAEAPTIHAITSAFAPKGVHVLAILSTQYGKNYDTSGRTDLRPVEKSDITWYQSQFNVNYPILIDHNFTTVDQYSISSFPTIYIVNGKGKITYTNNVANATVPTQSDLTNYLNTALKS